MKDDSLSDVDSRDYHDRVKCSSAEKLLADKLEISQRSNMFCCLL